MLATDFKHMHAAHCESGVTAALLGHAGLELTEPLAFGLGGGLFFAYPPFARVMGMPLISFRSYPGSLFGLTCKRLGVRMERRKFSTAEKGEAELDRLLAEGIPVGLQANMHWLSYFPREFRSQFNGHNLIALAREGSEYLISDPMLEEPVRIGVEALRRARFAKGILAPKGVIYRPLQAPSDVDIRPALCKAIRATSRGMLVRFPIVGVRGIERLSRHIRRFPRTEPDEGRRRLLLGNIVRMQEEVGTGGAGFRFLYAAFLQEAADVMGHEPWHEASRRMTDVGDIWRGEFAGACGRVIKGRVDEITGTGEAADAVLKCSREEESIYRYLLANSP